MSEQMDRIEGRIEDTGALERLAKLTSVEYDRIRTAEAEKLGVRVTTLDAEVKRRRGANGKEEARLLFPEIEPAVDHVDGGGLLTEIAGEIRRYIVLSEHAETAAALWILHTYAVEASYVAPILAVQSPQKRCGKTQLLKLLAALVHRGLLTENFSLAALYRVMDEYKPVLLIDEADAFLDDQDEIRGIINAGHSRGTRTLRIGGENRNEVEVFDAFGPKAIAGIGKRKDTIADRSIIITLHRRRKDEQVELLRLDRLGYSELQSRCAGWAAQNMDALKLADPAMPEILHDRAQDNWRPLIAIADICGWGAKARQTAMALTETDDAETVGAMVLEDIQRLFTERCTDRLASADIVEALADLEGRPWPEWGRSQKPITQRQLARLLSPFKIAPRKIRIEAKTANGYLLDQFTESFSRYLISEDSSGTAEQSSSGAASDAFRSGTHGDRVPDRSGTGTGHVPDGNDRKASNGAGCSGVPDRMAEMEGDEERADPEYRI